MSAGGAKTDRHNHAQRAASRGHFKPSQWSQLSLTEPARRARVAGSGVGPHATTTAACDDTTCTLPGMTAVLIGYVHCVTAAQVLPPNALRALARLGIAEDRIYLDKGLYRADGARAYA